MITCYLCLSVVFAKEMESYVCQCKIWFQPQFSQKLEQCQSNEQNPSFANA